MRRSLLAPLFLLAWTGGGFAADVLPVETVTDWSGLYAGIVAGYGVGPSDGVTYEGSYTPKGRIPGLIEDGVYPRSLAGDLQGLTGGVQLGYNVQHGKLVFGVETDVMALGLEDEGSYFHPADEKWNDDDSKASQSIDWLGTARLRLGVSAGDFLLYGTGGLAFGHTSFDYSVTNLSDVSGGESEWKLGWAAGGGAEYALDERWTVTAEYLYFDLGQSSSTDAYAAPYDKVTEERSAEFNGSLFQLGVKHRFGL
jgi:outer membrane immunogenic protein